MKKLLILVFLLSFAACTANRFNVEKYKQKLMSIHFSDKDMYFVGDSFKVGDSTLTIVNIYPPRSDRYGRVELTVNGKNGFKKVFLDKWDYYIVDSSHAIVILDVDTTSSTDKNVTIGICPPTKLPIKLNRIELESASLSPKEFLIKLNGNLIKLNMDNPFKGKRVFIKLTAVSTSSNALDRRGTFTIDLVLGKKEKIFVGDNEVEVRDIKWNKIPSLRKVVLNIGIESFILGEGGSEKLDNKVNFRVAKIGEGYVELIFIVRDALPGENIKIPSISG